MNNQYRQLSIEEREAIQLGLWQRRSIRSIAQALGRSPSTISRELKRNVFTPARRVYRPRLAGQCAKERIVCRGRRPRLKNQEIREYVHQKLLADFSPEQIAGRLRLEQPGITISHEAIYQYIYSQYYRAGNGTCHGEDLRRYLKRKHLVRRRKNVPFKTTRNLILGRISINERPKQIDLRQELGHWEGDSLVSRQSQERLNTLVERKSGLVYITKIADGTAAATAEAVCRRLLVLPKKKRQTLTVDNGSENSAHAKITAAAGAICYFANAYHSWERGTNENTNGLIRYYLPKKTNFAPVSEERIKEIENKLNNRPRKRLGWHTPLEVFKGSGVALEC